MSSTEIRSGVQFLGVRRAWVGIALFMFCILISVYSSMAISYHLSKGWNGYETVRAIVVDTTTAIPTAAAIPVMVLFLGVEVPMILYPLVKDWIEERQAEARSTRAGLSAGKLSDANGLNGMAVGRQRKPPAKTSTNPTPLKNATTRRKTNDFVSFG